MKRIIITVIIVIIALTSCSIFVAKNDNKTPILSEYITPEYIYNHFNNIAISEDNIWVLISAETNEYYKGPLTDELIDCLKLKNQTAIAGNNVNTDIDIQITFRLGEKHEMIIDNSEKIYAWYGYDDNTKIAFAEYSQKVDLEKIIKLIEDHMVPVSYNNDLKKPYFYFAS